MGLRSALFSGQSKDSTHNSDFKIDICNLRIVEIEKNDKILYIAFKFLIKQVRTNIGLADTLIPSSFLYLIYMGGTGPCEPMTIIFGSVIKS